MKKVIATILVLLAAACSDTHPDNFAFDAGPDGSSDSDTDSDSDSDSDAGPDSSTDTDTDTDSDSDSDAGLDGSTDTDTDTDSDSDTDSNTDSDTETETEEDAGVDGGEDAGPVDPMDCDGGRYDSATGLCWQEPYVPWPYDPDDDLIGPTWYEAVDYCDTLVSGGHDDWYLPTYADFVALFDNCDATALMYENGGRCDICSTSYPCGEMFDPSLDLTTDSWTSTTYDSATAVYVHGHLGIGAGTNFYSSVREPSGWMVGRSVRCVRHVY